MLLLAIFQTLYPDNLSFFSLEAQERSSLSCGGVGNTDDTKVPTQQPRAGLSGSCIKA